MQNISLNSKIMKKNLLICGSILLLFVFAHNLRSQGVKQVKLTDFSLQSSVLVDETGEMISSPAFNPDIYWFPVKVPCTVLTGLTANNIYPDPYSGLNNMLIPDASDEFNRMYGLEKYSHLPGHPNPWKKPYWYRTKFHVPEEDRGRHFQLIFKGINYRAAVWVNGIQIADSAEMAGMFSQYSLDISKHVRAGEETDLRLRYILLTIRDCLTRNSLRHWGIFT
jgi:exo-1,4-beta-D-glucosaminidase